MKEPWTDDEMQKVKRQRNVLAVASVVLVLAVVLVFSRSAVKEAAPVLPPSAEQTQEPPVDTPVPGTASDFLREKAEGRAQAVAVPVQNGDVLLWPSSEPVAPFNVETKGDGGYYIYLKSKASPDDDMAFYVVGGKNIETAVPLGRYTMYYATGDTWYGDELKFGEETAYYEGDTELSFYTFGDTVYGQTVELYLQAYGNFDTSEIEQSDFPG